MFIPLSNKLKKLSLAQGKIVSLLTLILSLVLIIWIWSERWELGHLATAGYLGIFLIMFLSSATVLVAVPGLASVFIAANSLNPIFLSFSAGLGSALGELVGYFFGKSGGEILSLEKRSRKFKIINDYFQKHGFITILVFAFLPLPFDLVGLAAGTAGYPLKKFFPAVLLGKSLKALTIATLGGRLID